MNPIDRRIVDGIAERSGESLGEPDANGTWTLELARSRLHGVVRERDILLRIVREQEAELEQLRAP